MGDSLLRTRGGISGRTIKEADDGDSSPHTRRYFPLCITLCSPARLFSAHAEVFPKNLRIRQQEIPLLRTRGGISAPTALSLEKPSSSPHTRRYFPGTLPGDNQDPLFSAHAEVFPYSTIRSSVTPSLLRTRGGISRSAGHRSLR